MAAGVSVLSLAPIILLSWRLRNRAGGRADFLGSAMIAAAWLVVWTALVSILTFCFSLALESRDLRAAQDWVEKAVVAVDQFRSMYGHYPSRPELAEVVGGPPSPWGDEGVFYKCDESGFSFDIPTGLTSGVLWGSARRDWVSYD